MSTMRMKSNPTGRLAAKRNGKNCGFANAIDHNSVDMNEVRMINPAIRTPLAARKSQ